jgi:hypothetical protein
MPKSKCVSRCLTRCPVEEVRVHSAQPVLFRTRLAIRRSHHSALQKNRHGRFATRSCSSNDLKNSRRAGRARNRHPSVGGAAPRLVIPAEAAGPKGVASGRSNWGHWLQAVIHRLFSAARTCALPLSSPILPWPDFSLHGRSGRFYRNDLLCRIPTPNRQLCRASAGVQGILNFDFPALAGQ